MPVEQIEPLPIAAENGLGGEIAAVGERLIVLIDAERALGSLLPGRPKATRPRPRGGRGSS